MQRVHVRAPPLLSHDTAPSQLPWLQSDAQLGPEYPAAHASHSTLLPSESQLTPCVSSRAQCVCAHAVAQSVPQKPRTHPPRQTRLPPAWSHVASVAHWPFSHLALQSTPV